jgi:hypothetical protein
VKLVNTPSYTTDGEWIDAGDLTLGTEIVALDGTFGTIEAVTVAADAQPVYNLTVDTAHTFFVGDGQWLVHNEIACWPENKEITELGTTLAQEAKNALREVPPSYRKKITIAVANADGDRYITLNGRAHREFQGAVDAVKKYADDNDLIYFPNIAADTHAERFLYDELKPDFIGISHASGPCPQCQGYLDKTNVIITYDNTWIK